MKTSGDEKFSPIRTFPILAFQDNYIWILEKQDQVVIVDPGAAAPVLEYIEQSRMKIVSILLTHHHADHIGGVLDLIQKSQSSEISVYGPAMENIEGCNHQLLGGEEIRIPNFEITFKVISVPGHTRGHLAYYTESVDLGGNLFCGDTLFGAGCGRLFEGTPAQMHQSLVRLSRLPESTKCYCAHEYTQANLRFALAVEPENLKIQERIQKVAQLRNLGQATVPFTLGGELETNPFLRVEVPAVRDSAAHFLGHEPSDDTETFAAIRSWKNQFS